MEITMADQSPHATEALTLGESRVRTKFNPSADTLVDKIKSQSAALIDLCATLTTEKSETKRLVALAQSAYEEAAMWAVKAATAGQ
jgi:hypothetical protein